MDVRLVHPFTCIFTGPTGCGKTTFVERLLRNATSLVNSPPEQITWCYGEWQPLYTSDEPENTFLGRVTGGEVVRLEGA